jgi:putative endonuclease
LGALDGRAELGRRAEAMAAELLERAGMRVLARNWRRPEGELDLVAIDTDGSCVFCEVRSRTGEASGDPLESVDSRKRARVIRAARLFLASEPIAATAYRFDVVAVTFLGDGHEPRVVHIPAAFETST